jgi:hypothetical protein
MDTMKIDDVRKSDIVLYVKYQFDQIPSKRYLGGNACQIISAIEKVGDV